MVSFNFFLNYTTFIWLNTTDNIINWGISMRIFQSINCIFVTIFLFHHFSDQPGWRHCPCKHNIVQNHIKRLIVTCVLVDCKLSRLNCSQKKCWPNNTSSWVNVFFTSVNIYLSDKGCEKVCVWEILLYYGLLFLFF